MLCKLGFKSNFKNTYIDFQTVSLKLYYMI